MKLFRVNEDGELVIDRDEILLVKEFHKILTKDKGSARDSQARKKMLAFKEFAFIYFYTDYTSPYIERDDKDRMRVSKLEACLEDDWTPDAEVKDGIRKYKELQNGFAINSFIELKKGLKSTYEAITLINQQTSIFINMVSDKLTKVQDLKDVNPADLVVLNTALIGNIGQMTKLAKQTMQTMEEIEKYEEKIKSEESDERKIKGGVAIGNREIPK